MTQEISLKRGSPGVATVVQLLDAGLPQTEVARRLGVSRQRIHQIAHGYKTVGRGSWSAHKTFRLQEFRCGACLASLADSERESHHIIPNQVGGSDDPTNLMAVCHPCHTALHVLRRNRARKPEPKEEQG